MKELVVVGSGPAALTAALYAAREGVGVTVYEKESLGGLAGTIDVIENYPGTGNVTGAELVGKMREQAESFGAEFDYGEVNKLEDRGDVKVLTVDGMEVEARSVLIATGCARRKLGVPGEAEFDGRGVHYCAICDGAFYKDKKVIVIGGANSAIQEALFLAKFASEVEIVALFDIMASGVLRGRLEEAVKSGKVKVNTYADTVEVVSKDGKVVGVRVKEESGERVVEGDGVFVFIGLVSTTEFLEGSGVELSERGFVVTDESYETGMKGVFAAGDVREGATRQIVCAAGEGAAAALVIGEYLGE
ncbi:FAD-dependent oxidoreductase [Candidatus Saccharibacteria bacterium]|nr:FAD-dependent oxidoreductase [Candidatus Saccharibacteria bacterium]